MDGLTPAVGDLGEVAFATEGEDVVEADAGRGVHEGVPGVVARREAWERGFAAWVEDGRGGAVVHRVVADAAGVDVGTARRWCEVGEEGLGLVSYRDRMRDAAREVVARDKRGETLEAVERRGMDAMARDRARALAKARETERKVLGDAVKQRAEEAMLVRGVRQTATAMLSAEAHLLKAAIGLSQSIAADVDAKTLTLKPGEKVRLVRDIASIVKATAETARLAVSTERMVLGKPGGVLGSDTATDDMTPEEAEAYIAMATRAMARRARARVVVDVAAE